MHLLDAFPAGNPRSQPYTLPPWHDAKILVYDGVFGVNRDGTERHQVASVYTQILEPPLEAKPVVNTHTGRETGQRTPVRNVKKHRMDEFMAALFPHIQSRRGRIKAFERRYRKERAKRLAKENFDELETASDQGDAAR